MTTEQQNQEIINEIENKHIFNLVNKYVKIEEEILNELCKLPSWANACSCKNEEEKEHLTIVFRNRHQEKYPDKFCLNCGGYVINDK